MKRLFFIAIASICYISSSFAQAEQIKTESSAPAEDIYIDDIVTKRMTVESKVLAYEPVREADIAWEKRIWRLIDTREKMNLPWRAEEQPFFNVLKDLLKNGDITVFKDEKFKEPLAYEEVEKSLVKIDTTETFDPETYEQKIVVSKNTKDWRNITQFRLKEIWFFDEEASMMKNRILGFAPLYSEIIDGLDRPLVIPLFWVYYPEARVPLSKYRVLSDNNDVAPMTWTDLFDNRYFSSMIYKKSNILDMKVEEYFSTADEMFGIDNLMESEKIKMELFNFEHDLWEY
jgi:gliding motility associated protien GldN